MIDREKVRRDFLHQTKWSPAYLAFIVLYPFHLEDLVGEVWKDIIEYEGLYQVSNYGRIKSFPRSRSHREIKILKPKMQKNGYLNICLCKNSKLKTWRIHRLVAQAFIPNPNNLPEVNHRFGIKFDCYFENLEWSNSSENIQHAYDTDLNKSGEKHYKAKLSNEDVKWIREHYIPRDKKYGIKALAKKFNIKEGSMRKVIHKRTYKNIE